MSHYYCLIDCDNFFATCEKIFHPQFREKPLVVASGKNGIVIARSKEAKALGIPMCAASFQYRSLFIKEDVITRSPNHTLYQDISNRVRETVATFAFPTFIYSIDEMFLKIPKEQLSDEFLEKIQTKIKRWTGVDVSLGVSTTKTLAKVATKLAKKTTSHRLNLTRQEEILTSLQTFPIDDIWGIGRNSAKKLKTSGVRTAKDLLLLNEKFTAKLLGICGARIQKELKGEVAHPFEEERKDKSLQITRTFTEEIVSIQRIKKIIASFTTEGCEKLRRMKKEAGSFNIFLHSSRFKENKKHFNKTYTLDSPSNFTPDFLHLKEEALQGLQDGEIIIKRAGIHFFDLSPQGASQQNLFVEKPKKGKALMNTLDAINQKYGNKTLRFASTDKHEKKRFLSSSNYTTCWDSILEINI